MGNAVAQLIGPSQEAVAQARALALIPHLLIDIRQQILGLLIRRLREHQLVQEFRGMAVLALIKQGLSLRQNGLSTAHHLHIKRG